MNQTQTQNIWSERFHYEKDDCTVVALAQAFNISYESSHALCKAYGRIDRKGFFPNAKLLGHLRTQMALLPMWYNRKLSFFLDRIKEGTFLILIKGHMLCVKNGERLDRLEEDARIERCFLVKE